jgi:hypothetical protein
VACGCHSSFAITNRGSLFSWGENGYGQLGHGDRDPKNIPMVVQFFPSGVTYVSAKLFHVGVLTSRGHSGGNTAIESPFLKVDLDHPSPDMCPNIQVLHDPLDQAVCDVIFVADSKKVWASRAGGLWPVDWLSRDLQVCLNHRIAVISSFLLF